MERAREFGSLINLIEFTKNQGYGAAIMEAWSESPADILGFLDADGTCDPNFFATLCRNLVEQDADIVLMLYRQSMYNEDCDNPNETDVYVRKNRNGPTGRATLYFDSGKMSFRDVSRS